NKGAPAREITRFGGRRLVAAWVRGVPTPQVCKPVIWSRQVATYESGDKSPHSKFCALRAGQDSFSNMLELESPQRQFRRSLQPIVLRILRRGIDNVKCVGAS